MKILYLAANPQWVKVEGEEEHQEYDKLELWQELRGVSDVLFDARAEGSVVLEVVPEARRRDVVRYLSHRQPDVLHFSGHGEVDGLVLADEGFSGEMVSGEWLKGVLAGKDVGVLLLNCCWSDEILQGLEEEVGVVIGSTQDLPEDHAANFSEIFYNALQSGLTVEKAFELGTRDREGLYHQKVLKPEIWKNQLKLEQLVSPAVEVSASATPTKTVQHVAGDIAAANPAQKMIEYGRELDRMDVRLKTNIRWDWITVIAASAAALLGALIGCWLGWPEWTQWEPSAIALTLIAKPSSRIAGYVAMYIGSYDLRDTLGKALEVLALRPGSDIQTELATERIELMFSRLKKLEEGAIKAGEKKAGEKKGASS